MTIKVLVCHEDGTQMVEEREVSDEWFDTLGSAEKEKTK